MHRSPNLRLTHVSLLMFPPFFIFVEHIARFFVQRLHTALMNISFALLLIFACIPVWNIFVGLWKATAWTMNTHRNETKKCSPACIPYMYIRIYIRTLSNLSLSNIGLGDLCTVFRGAHTYCPELCLLQIETFVVDVVETVASSPSPYERELGEGILRDVIARCSSLES